MTHPKAKSTKPFQCMECGKRLSLKAAEKASSDAQGCPKCGGADIDLARD